MKVFYLFLLVAGPFCARAQRMPQVIGAAKVQLLAPDQMPCWTPKMALVERMPVDTRGNPDRMPNRLPVDRPKNVSFAPNMREQWRNLSTNWMGSSR